MAKLLIFLLLELSTASSDYTVHCNEKARVFNITVGVFAELDSVKQNRLRTIITENDIKDYFRDCAVCKYMLHNGKNKRELIFNLAPIALDTDSVTGLYRTDIKALSTRSIHWVDARSFGLCFVAENKAYFFSESDSTQNKAWLIKHDLIVRKVLGQHWKDFSKDMIKGVAYFKD